MAAESSSKGGAIKLASVVIAALTLIFYVVFGVISYKDATAHVGSAQLPDGGSVLEPSSASPSASATPVPDAEQPSADANVQAAVVSPPTLASFDITTVLGFSGSGIQAGPDLYQIGDGSGVQVAYDWHARMSDGSGNTTASCQILGTVTGPQSVDSFRTDSCTDTNVNGFTGDKNIMFLKAPGTYTVTVTDELTGISNQHAFNVIP